MRNVKTGKVRAITGETYMLNQDEELYSKELSPGAEALLASEKDPTADRNRKGNEGGAKTRDKTKVSRVMNWVNWGWR